MALVLEGRAAEVDDADVGAQRHAAAEPPAALAVELGEVVRVAQQHVLRLQVRVHDIERVEEGDRVQELARELLDDVEREGPVAVLAHEVV